MKKTLASTAALLVFPITLAAQPSVASNIPAGNTRFYATGAAFQTYAHPELTGWAAIGIPLDRKRQNWSFTEYDAIPTSDHPVKIQTSVRTGFATQIRTIGPLYIFALIDGGYATTGADSGGAIGGGFMAVQPLGRTGNWKILAAYKILKTSVAPGSPKQFYLGFGRTF